VFVREATVLHADVDAFFASVEQRDDPRLRGRPVIVGLGVVLAASYEAKASGVETAMSGRRARRLCPTAVVVAPRMSAYADASKAVYRVFEDTAPIVEGMSIDEAFLDVRGLERIAGTPVEIARRLRQSVLERVGLPLSVGVARTKFPQRWQAVWRSRTGFWQYRPSASSRSSIPCRSSGCGASAPQRQRNSAPTT
jgi:DNA polymerase-4